MRKANTLSLQASQGLRCGKQVEIRTTSYLMPSIPLSGTSARWLLNLIDIRVSNNVDTHVSHPTFLCSVAFNRSWSVLFDLVCGLWHDRALMEPHPDGYICVHNRRA